MFATLIYKELMDTLRSLRFVVGWLLMVALMVAAVFFLSADVRDRIEQIEAIEKDRTDNISKYSSLNRVGAFMITVRPPESSEILFRGLDNPLEDSTFYSDPLVKLFPKLDLIYIVSILLSLLAVIFTYDAICGEREDGTLRLIHSTPISRSLVIIAKWIGNWIAIGVPFILVFFFVVLLGSFIGGLSLSAETLAEMGAICLVSLLYVGFFLVLGLLVSALVRHAGTSILVLLLLWVVFTLVIPNVSPIISAQINPLPSVAEIEYQATYIRDVERDNRLVEALKTLCKRFNREYNIPPEVIWLENMIRPKLDALNWSEEEKKDFSARWMEELISVARRVNEEQRAKARALRNELQRKIDQQADLARWISLLSPTPAFLYCSTDIASVGLRGEEIFREESSAYTQMFNTYLDEQVARQEKELGRRMVYNERIDLPNWPRFHHKTEPISDRLAGALPYAGLIVLYMLIALEAACISYLRYDVR